MTSKERVKTVYSFGIPDRVPTTELCVNHPVATRLLGREAICGFGGFIRGKTQNTMLISGQRDEFVEKFTRDTLEVNRLLGFDIFQFHFMPARGTHDDIKDIGDNQWRIDGGNGRYAIFKWDPGTDFYGEVETSFDKDPEKELKIMIDEVTSDPVARMKPGEDDFFRKAREEYPDHFMWGCVGFGFPYSEDGIMSLIEYPTLWREYQELLCEKNKTSIDMQIELGADAFWSGQDWAFKNGPMMSEDTFREIFFEPFKEMLKYIHSKGLKFIHHTDGNIEKWEKMWFEEIGIDGYHAIEPSAGMDILALRKRNPKTLLHGNLDCGNLLTMGTESGIEDEVIRLVQGLAPSSGWVFSSSNSIHSGVPIGNLNAMIRAIRHHGTYPVSPKTKLYQK